MNAHIIHHKAALDDIGCPPNSLAAVAACLEAGAEWIEVDICALESGDFLLVHTHDLSAETSGRGRVDAYSPAQTRALRLVHNRRVSEHPPALLSEVVSLLLERGGPTRLQLDWKDHAPYHSSEPLERLARLITPLGERALVSSMADWQLRALARVAPHIALGFDIHLHIDYDPSGSAPEPDVFPRGTGAYGYRDDHPLASGRWGTPADYLAQRCDELMRLVPRAQVFYCRHTFLARSLADGYDWAAALHAHGIKLDAWTLDADNAEALANARLLAAHGCDLFTSNTPLALGRFLEEGNG